MKRKSKQVSRHLSQKQ